MRRVEIHKWKADPNNKGRNKRVKVYEGFFHQWGVDYEEFETNAGNFSIAIIERDNGTIESIPVDLIKFINKPAINPSRFINAIGEPIRSTFDDNAC